MLSALDLTGFLCTCKPLGTTHPLLHLLTIKVDVKYICLVFNGFCGLSYIYYFYYFEFREFCCQNVASHYLLFSLLFTSDFFSIALCCVEVGLINVIIPLT